MTIAEAIFIVGIATLFYSYIGYGILLYMLVRLFRSKRKSPVIPVDTSMKSPITIVIAAFNEESFIRQKIENTLALEYPPEKLTIIFVTDGSSDNTPAIVREYPRIILLHEDQRKGKIFAMDRAMAYVKTPIVVYSDANTLLNSKSILNIEAHFVNPKVGGVAGEKKVIQEGEANAAGAGESLYWKYESTLKKLDWEFYTVVGAAGELFALRTKLYEFPGEDVLLDDFILSLRVCMKGYRVAYEPAAFATETPSYSITEEKKRKIRISAGGFQSMVMLRQLFNIFRYPVLSFQYISHRVLRWTLCPLFLPIVFFVNIYLVFQSSLLVYQVILFSQVIFYAGAFIGWLLTINNKKAGPLYALYYFVFMNYNLYLGFFKYLSGRQSVVWDKARR